MKVLLKTLSLSVLGFISFHVSAQKSLVNTGDQVTVPTHLFMDVHRLTPGKVKFEAVAQAHAKDLAVEGKYGVQFLKYWVDEAQGLVFCLASSSDSASLVKTHAEAHGLLPERVYPVTAGMEADLEGKKSLFLDIHYLGAGNVSAKDVAAAHAKDLAVQKKYGANFVNYWVDEKEGVVMCLVEAKNPSSLVKTHKEAHGLLPDKIFKVKQGQ
jgi:hypothetical protein